MQPGDIILSVSLITYNQVKYIKQAIEGVLQQKVNFSYELIIGDDCSTDGTRDILASYQQKYPDLIRLILHQKKNEGVPGKVNFLSTINAAAGKYIALLDGDDYWTDPLKLQKQVDFLEDNPGYAICCHRVAIQKDGKRPKLDEGDIYTPAVAADYTIEMMAEYGNLVTTPSVVYRNRLFSAFPSWFHLSPVGDYIVHMLNAQHGRIKYFPDVMAVYREHSGGAWSGKTTRENAAGMIGVIKHLLTEPFEEPVKKGLAKQLTKIKAVYLQELMQEDWQLFSGEFNSMMEEDKNIALALIEKMKTDMDIFRQSKTYKAIHQWRRIIKA